MHARGTGGSLGVLALGAYLVVAVGPAVYDYGMEAVVGPIEALPETGMVADPRARIAVPLRGGPVRGGRGGWREP